MGSPIGVAVVKRDSNNNLVAIKVKEPPYEVVHMRQLHSLAVSWLHDSLEHVDHLVKGRDTLFTPFLLGIFSWC